MRLNRYLSMCGLCSRREADRLIDEGRVSVNGQTAVTGMDVLDEDRVCLDGRPVKRVEKEIYLAVNKPRGVVVTTDKRWGDRTLEDMVAFPQRVFAVGRLDKDSEGLILMTNNGDLSNRIQKACGFHEKEYIVTTDHPLTASFLQKLSAGVYLEELDRTTRPCRVSRISDFSFRIILTEGMNRQIRRMCAAYGYSVKQLRRVRVMNVKLGSLKEGCWRELTEEETCELKRQTDHTPADRKKREDAESKGKKRRRGF